MKKNSKFLNNTLVIACISCAAFGSSIVTAATSQNYTINLSATIPTDSFHVIPVDSGWINQTQDMGFDIATSKLRVFEKQFQYKNTAGGIQATLTGNLNSSGQPQLSNGTEVIPLTVSFNNIKVTDTAQTVVSTSEANVGGRTALKISQANDAALTINGSFTGSVAMIFEPVIGP